MKTVYMAASALDAQLIHDQLQDVGIEVFIAGLALSGAVGELPANLGPEVRVLNDDDYLKARALVEEITQQNNSSDITQRVCKNCGEVIEAGFNQCWKCGQVID